MSTKLVGTGVALATPMRQDYTVDYDSLEKLIKHTIENGVDYLVVLGTTGEAPVISWKEKLNILEFTFKVAGNSKPIVFGLGGNDTYGLIEKAKDLQQYELEAILSASPYYSKPSQQGIIRHYELLADAFTAPIILYNVPARTASNIEASTTLALAEHPNIVAMKEASGNLDQVQNIANDMPADFLLLSGDDATTLDTLKMGGKGIISVVANLLPKEFSDMVRLGLQGNYNEAGLLDNKLKKAYELLSREGNPTSLKAGLEVLNIGSRIVKPPLFDASEALIKEWEHYFTEAAVLE